MICPKTQAKWVKLVCIVNLRDDEYEIDYDSHDDLFKKSKIVLALLLESAKSPLLRKIQSVDKFPSKPPNTDRKRKIGKIENTMLTVA